MRRPGRPRANVGRSIGVAEHHIRTVLTRLNVTRLVAVAVLSALGFVPAIPAHAATSERPDQGRPPRRSTPPPSAGSPPRPTRRASTPTSPTSNTGSRSSRRAWTTRARSRPPGRSSSTRTPTSASARCSATARSTRPGAPTSSTTPTPAATPRSRSSRSAVDDLNAQRRDLQAQKAQQQKILREVATERAGPRRPARRRSSRGPPGGDGRARRRARPGGTAARRREVHVRRARPGQQLDQPVGRADRSADRSRDATSFVVRAVDDGRVSPHHDDPFLVCTRARESGGRVRRGQPVGLLRRVPIPAVHVGHHRSARAAAATSSACSRRARRSSTRTRSRGRCTSGRARARGADAADDSISRSERALRRASCRRANATADRRARDRGVR